MLSIYMGENRGSKLLQAYCGQLLNINDYSEDSVDIRNVINFIIDKSFTDGIDSYAQGYFQTEWQNINHYYDIW